MTKKHKCDMCGKESEFDSFWIFCINETVIDPRFFPRLWVLRGYGSRNPEVVRVCRKCRYTANIADMYDGVYKKICKRMMNRRYGKYAKAQNKRAVKKRPRARGKNRGRF